MLKVVAAAAGLLVLPVFITAMATPLLGQHGSGPNAATGLHPILVDAYTRAAVALPGIEPGCTGLTWAMIAGIAAVESDHAAGRDIAGNGDITPPVVGPRLDGSGVGGNLTPHHDTDGGRWDGDADYDRAVGVTQHLPANWAAYGRDGNGDGVADPHNAYDATLSTAVELCRSHPTAKVDFTDRAQLRGALFRYNRADWYVEDVLEAIDRYSAFNTTPTAVSGDGQGADAARWALQQVGWPYVWGGESREEGGFDCSGLVLAAWAHAGVDLPRVTTDQFTTGTPVELDELRPGDLLFYDTGGPGPPPAHVTMYVGEGQMVNAPSTGKKIRVEPVEGDYYSPRFMGARRP
ncbi:bifunctional lytic transglycosylase/C40 family peptidase [Nocardiopsis composta]|uniref:Cell wall-associated NlpC family hydrolase n=1 Tax=Nocardiopsis composta TaxID=157465 RepID=A0A7W8QRL2_9ACTN|nr:bifunctional lytic transglycosylase/C40 family peptidase [Nocardiopsis composta]MBB5435199.1 cell wall-associated NlpC family hydrolase [Nocardiopsis composta]